MSRIEAERRRWVERVFPDPSDPYDRVWHGKLAFWEVGNGDLLALDLEAAADPPVVYLSHDDGEGHGYQIGPNFIEAVNRWTRIGCVGAGDWAWFAFVSSPTSGLETDGENARAWRAWLGVDI